MCAMNRSAFGVRTTSVTVLKYSHTYFTLDERPETCHL